MLSNPRQEKILNYLKKNRSATVKELATALYVSEATIRRSLVEMQEIGLLRRNHGGAVLLEEADEISIFVRMTENAYEKEVVATKALKALRSDYRTIFLDSSSTVLALAQRMNLSNKTVVVNNLETALRLTRIKGINLIVPGGTIDTTAISITGSWANTLLSDFHFDLMLASCAAIIGRGAYETSLDQRDIKRTVFDRSKVRILVADHTKFTEEGNYLFKDLSEFDKVVLDEIPKDRLSDLKGLPIIV